MATAASGSPFAHVEATLARHELIRRTVMVMREDRKDEPKTIVVVWARSGRTLTGGELKDYLGDLLPDQKACRFVILSERCGLQYRDETSHCPPEQTRRLAVALSALWADVLDASHVTVDDNFQDLAGHSLHAMRFVNRLEDLFGVEVPVRLIFEHPTAAALARAMADDTTLADRLRQGIDVMTTLFDAGGAP